MRVRVRAVSIGVMVWLGHQKILNKGRITATHIISVLISYYHFENFTYYNVSSEVGGLKMAKNR